MYSSNVMKGGYAQKNNCYMLTEFSPTESNTSDDKCAICLDADQEQIARAEAVMILDDAKDEAQQIIRDAKKRAAEIIKGAERRSEEMYADSYLAGKNEGYSDGYKSGAEDAKSRLEPLINEIKSLSNCIARQRDEFIENHQSIVIDLALDIASKVACDNFTKGIKSFYSIFEEMTKKLPPAEKLILTVSEHDFEVVAHDIQQLRSIAESFNDIEIRCDNDAKAGTLMLESPVMVIDASINTQLELLKDSLAAVRE